MLFHLNILNLLALLCGLCCLRIARREVRGRLVRPGRLFAAPVFAVLTALFLLSLVPPERRLMDVWLIFLGVGCLSGLLSGLEASMQVDHDYTVLRLPRTNESWFVVGPLAFVLVSLVADLTIPRTSVWEALVDIGAANGAVLCAAHLGTRATIVWLRHLRAPHLQLIKH